MRNDPIYLDNAATTPMWPDVAKVISDTYHNHFGNPSSIHQFGRKAKAIVETSREIIAEQLQVMPASLIFTGSGTEANNLAILGSLSGKTKGHIISSEVEHPAVLNTVRYLTARGFSATCLQPDSSGVITPGQVRDALTDDTLLVSLMAVNNETGVHNDCKAIGEVLPDDVIFHTDMVQTIGKIDSFAIPRRVNFASFAGHKIHGPKGIGMLFHRGQVPLQKIMHGGSQEVNMRPGTENVALIAGLAETIRLMPEVSDLTDMRELFETQLQAAVHDIEINGGSSPRAAHISNIHFKNVRNDSLIMQLDLAGIMASMGSACSSGSINPSPVLLAMGLTEAEAKASIRFSFGAMNTAAEVEKAVAVIASVVRKNRENG
jgi:cysteine desulfurase